MCNKQLCHDFKMANGGNVNKCLFETSHSDEGYSAGYARDNYQLKKGRNY